MKKIIYSDKEILEQSNNLVNNILNDEFLDKSFNVNINTLEALSSTDSQTIGKITKHLQIFKQDIAKQEFKMILHDFLKLMAYIFDDEPENFQEVNGIIENISSTSTDDQMVLHNLHLTRIFILHYIETDASSTIRKITAFQQELLNLKNTNIYYIKENLKKYSLDNKLGYFVDKIFDYINTENIVAAQNIEGIFIGNFNSLKTKLKHFQQDNVNALIDKITRLYYYQYICDNTAEHKFLTFIDEYLKEWQKGKDAQTEYEKLKTYDNICDYFFVHLNESTDKYFLDTIEVKKVSIEDTVETEDTTNTDINIFNKEFEKTLSMTNHTTSTQATISENILKNRPTTPEFTENVKQKKEEEKTPFLGEEYINDDY